jgi:thioredoxin 2
MTNTVPATRPALVKCVFCGAANRVDLARFSDNPKCGKCGKPIRLDRPLKVNDEDFDKTLRGSSVPVVVDFYADWCGPCHMMAPTLDDFALRHAGDVLVLKLDTDANPAAPARLGVRGLPTVVAFEKGQETRRHVGVTDLATLEKLVNLESKP